INTSGAKATYAINQYFAIGTHQAGTTAQAASSPLERYARRVAFKRKIDDTLELTQWSNGEVTPIPLGINTGGKVDQFPYDTYGTKAPRSADNALWFRTTSNTTGKPYNDANYATNQPLFYIDNAIATTQQPSLVPVLQIHTPEGAPAS
ncbi:hypothetical protein AAHH59_10495, partial [Pediococcus acidilactici]|uniref:hypothetical protein n=1 Tax=Pediococcus acidilactici TaxID=1254 RepID=UPI0031896A81